MASEVVRRHDVIVVGAGPAGLACAAALARDGRLSICLVDAAPQPGGQYWRQPPVASGATAVTRDEVSGLHHDLATVNRLRADLDAAVAAGSLTLFAQHQVWTVVRELDGGLVVHAVDRSGGAPFERAVSVSGRALVIATGAHDIALPFPGWDLPGVMTIGGMQALLKGSAVAVGRRVAIGGTGPFLLPVAAGLAARGVEVVGVFEANPLSGWLGHLGAVARNPGKLLEGAGYAATLARHRVPVQSRAMIIAAEGAHRANPERRSGNDRDRGKPAERVGRVTVARLGRDGRIRPGTHRSLEVDAVGIGWGFTPVLDLPRTLGVELTTDASGAAVVAVDDRQRTSVEAVYAAGEVCGIGGAALALAEGQLAAEGVLAGLVGSGSTSAAVRRRAASLRRFAAAMHQAHAVPAAAADVLTDSTLVCRCEEVRCERIRQAVADGADDARQVKQLTRAGMGWCQGRVCGPAVDLLCAAGSTSGDTFVPGPPPERLVATPIRLGTLAADHVSLDEADTGSG